MLVRITPPGRAARVFSVPMVKRSWHIDGGCAAATIPLALSAEDIDRILLSRVDVFGPLGLDWSGMVWRRPRSGEPIECAGLANALTFKRRPALYCDTSLNTWKQYMASNYTPNGMSYGLGVASIVVTVNAATYTAGAQVEAHKVIPSSNGVRVKGTLTLPASSGYQVRLYTATDPTAGSTLRATYTANGAFDTVVNATGIASLRLYFGVNTGTTAATNLAFTITDLKVYGVKGVATGAGQSLTPEAVIADAVNQLPTWVLPAGAAYRAYIGTSGVTLPSAAFPDPTSTDKAKVDSVSKLSDHHFGFYPRRIVGTAVTVPVYESVETMPSLMLDVTRIPDASLRDHSADAMASEYLVAYEDENGQTRYVKVADPDDSYLSRIGYEITGVVDATFTTSSTVATAAGTVAAARAADTEGTATVIRARTANGRLVSPLACMPGRMVRVRGLGRDRLLTIASAEAEGAHVRVSFARKQTDLSYLAARSLSR